MSKKVKSFAASSSFLKKLFLENWQRKTVALVLALIIWLVVNRSLTTTRTLSGIPVRIVHIPQGKIIEGVQSDGLLPNRITLTITGNLPQIDELSANDLEITIDAKEHEEEWSESITKKNLVSLNPDIDVSKIVKRISHPTLTFHFLQPTLLPLDQPIPLSLFYPLDCLSMLDPTSLSITSTPLIKNIKGVPFLEGKFFARGSDAQFLQIVKGMLQIEIVVVPDSRKNSLEWNIQFINPKRLENQYVSQAMSDRERASVHEQESYLRDRFHQLMSDFELCKEDGSPLNLNIQLQNNSIDIHL